MRLEMDESERQLLLSLLDELLGDLRDGIYRAETHEFKEQLKAKKEVVKRLLARLRPEVPIPAGAG